MYCIVGAKAADSKSRLTRGEGEEDRSSIENYVVSMYVETTGNC